MYTNLDEYSDEKRDGGFSIRPRQRKADVGHLREFSLVPRSVIHRDDVEEGLFSVKYSPDEFLPLVVDEDWDRGYDSPVETTVLVVDEDELIDRETVATRPRTDHVY